MVGHWSDWITPPPVDLLVETEPTNNGLSSQVRSYVYERRVSDTIAATGNPPNAAHAAPDVTIPPQVVTGLARLRGDSATNTGTLDTETGDYHNGYNGGYLTTDQYTTNSTGNFLDAAVAEAAATRFTGGHADGSRIDYGVNVRVAATSGALYFTDPDVAAPGDDYYEGLLTDLGIRYGVDPDTGLSVRRESDQNIRVGWVDFSVRWSRRYDLTNARYDGAAAATPTAAVFSVRVLPGAADPAQTSGSGAVTFHPAPDAGAEIASLTIAPGAAFAYDAARSTYPLGEASGVTAADDHVWIYLRPPTLDPAQDPTLGVGELPTPPYPGAFDGAQNANLFRASAELFCDTNAGEQPTVRVRYQFPRFRYWVAEVSGYWGVRMA